MKGKHKLWRLDWCYFNNKYMVLFYLFIYSHTSLHSFWASHDTLYSKQIKMESKGNRVFIRAEEQEPVGAGCYGSLEPEPVEKKTKSRSRKKYATPVPAPKDKKHKEIVHLLLFLRYNSKFSWFKTQLFDLFYVSCSFTLVVWGKKYFTKLNK